MVTPTRPGAVATEARRPATSARGERSALDDAAAEDGVAVVEHRTLAGSDPSLRLVPLDGDMVRIDDVDRGGTRIPMGTALHEAGTGDRDVRPDDVGHIEVITVEICARSPRQPFAEATSTSTTNRRPAPPARSRPLRWPIVTSSTAGTVPTSCPSVSTTRPAPQRGCARRGTLLDRRHRGDEADVLAVGLGRGAQAEPRPRSRAPRPWSMSPIGNSIRASSAWRQHVQHVGLVLGRVDAPGDAAGAVDRVDDAGVVPGGHRVEAERIGPSQQPVELEVAVALDARVRACARGVVRDVGRDDVRVEVVTEVEHVVIDAELLRRPGGRRRRRRPSSSRVSDSPPQSFIVTPTTSWPCVAQQRGRHRGVDAARHATSTFDRAITAAHRDRRRRATAAGTASSA